MTLNPQKMFLVFFVILGYNTHFKTKFRINLLLFYCMLYSTLIAKVAGPLLSRLRKVCSNYLFFS